MSAPVHILGVAPSSYVRTARMTCVEKGIEHAFELVEFGSPQHRADHPYAKVPIMKHGDVHLFETSAITHYLDAAFDGPKFMPNEPAALGKLEQWTSVLNCYAYQDLVLDYLLPMIREQADMAAMDAKLPRIESTLERLDAGDTVTLADLFWGPAVVGLPHLPPTKRILERCTNRWLESLQGRKSAQYLFPPTS